MTDSNFAYRNEPETPEDDDPLAELARIVAGGGVEKAEPKEEQPAPVAEEAPVELDIEAQLMRELSDAEPAPVADNAANQEGESGFSFSRQTPTIDSAASQTSISEPVSSLEDQLMAELGGGIEDSPTQSVPATEIIEAAEDVATAAEPLETVESIVADFNQEVAAAEHSGSDTQAKTGSDDPLEDFFSDNFADMLESEQAAELDVDTQQPTDASLDDVDFGDAFEAELAAVASSASDAGVVEPQSLDSLDLEDEFAKAFESELDLEEAPYVAAAAPALAEQPVEIAQADAPQLDEYQNTPHPLAAPEPKNSGFKLAVGALCAALLVGVGVVAWGSWSESTGSGSEPEVIKADTEPAKIKPEEPGGTQIANQDNQVYNQVAGNQTEEPAQETLITSRETVSEDAKSTERLVPKTEPASESGTLGIAPKKVRTLTVKPDGTIIQSAPAETTTATFTPPEKTEVEPAPVTNGDSTTQTAAADDTGVVSLDGAKSTGEIGVPAPSPLPAAQELALVAVQQPANPAPVTPEPKVTQSAPQQAAPTATQTAAPAADPNAPTQIANIAEAKRPTVASSEWKVQVSSQRSREAAESSFNNIKNRFGSVLGGRTADIQRADVDGRGTFYRVKVLASSKSEATQLCTRLKSAGGSCFVTR